MIPATVICSLPSLRHLSTYLLAPKVLNSVNSSSCVSVPKKLCFPFWFLGCVFSKSIPRSSHTILRSFVCDLLYFEKSIFSFKKALSVSQYITFLSYGITISFHNIQRAYAAVHTPQSKLRKYLLSENRRNSFRRVSISSFVILLMLQSSTSVFHMISACSKAVQHIPKRPFKRPFCSIHSASLMPFSTVLSWNNCRIYSTNLSGK